MRDDVEDMVRALRSAVPPAEATALAGATTRDLWPEVLARITVRRAPTRAEWALLAAGLAWLAFFPQGAVALFLLL
jgi:hypothetical protein